MKRWWRMGCCAGSRCAGGMVSGMPSGAITTAHWSWWMRWWWLQSRQPLARSVGPPACQAFRWWVSVQAGGRSQPGEDAPVVAVGEGDALVSVEQSSGAAEVEDGGVGAEDQREQACVAGEPAGL